MTQLLRHAWIIGLCTTLSGCLSETAGTQGDDGALSVQVDAHLFPGLTEARFTVVVTSTRGDRSHVTMGIPMKPDEDGLGQLVFETTCPEGEHVVAVHLESLHHAQGYELPHRDYTAPPLLTQRVRCAPAATQASTFSLTTTRISNGWSGRFANFARTFMSAKLDCNYDDGRQIELLNNAAGEPVPVVVLGLAHVESRGSRLTFSDVSVVCNGSSGTTRIDKDAEINQTHFRSDDDAVPVYAIYSGVEEIPPSVTKPYWNLAIGINEAAMFQDGQSCRVIALATVLPRDLADAVWDSNVGHPVVEFHVDLDRGEPGRVSCGQNPLNTLGSGVRLRYSNAETYPQPFTFESALESLRPEDAGPTTGMGMTGGAD